MIFIQIINFIFQLYTLMLIARILCSWLPELMNYRLMQVVAFYTDPYLNFFRRFIPALGMFDFSPIIAFFCLGFIQTALNNLIIRLI